MTGVTADGQAIGRGCVYPASVKTLADQLNASGKTWRAYMEDMGNDPAREATTCGHPAAQHHGHDTERRSAVGGGTARRPVRRAPQSLRLLPLDHRLAAVRRDVVNLNQFPLDLNQKRRRRTSSSSRRTSATTATTPTATTASPAGSCRPTPSCRQWVPASWHRRLTSTTDCW